MKITKFLMFCIIAVILLSCSEGEDPQPTSAGMVGAWSVTAVDYKGTTTTSAQGISIKADFTGTGKNMNLSATFTSNTINSEGSYIVVLKTTIGGQTTTEEYPVEEFFTNGSWSLNGKTLTIEHSNGSDVATVVEQTSTTLKLKWVVKETTTDQGITETTDITGTYTLTKK